MLFVPVIINRQPYKAIIRPQLLRVVLGLVSAAANCKLRTANFFNNFRHKFLTEIIYKFRYIWMEIKMPGPVIA